MAFGPEGIAAWNNMLFNMRTNRARTPYIEDMAKAERDLAISKASGNDATNYYKMAMANYLQNPNMAMKGLTAPTKMVLEQGLINAPGGLSNLVTPPGGLAGGPNQLGATDGGGLAGDMNAGPSAAPSSMQQLPLSPQQIQKLQQFAGGQGQPSPMKLGMQNGQMATNDQLSQQTGGQHNRDDINNMYNREIVNKTTDKLLQKRIDYAQHLETTLDQINPEVFTMYSGVKGKEKFARDYAAALRGNAPEEFKRYKALTDVTSKMFAGEIRQFQGDSVREDVRVMFEDLANPSSWLDPDVAAYKFKMLRTVLGSELKNDLNLAEKGPDYAKMKSRAEEDILIDPKTGRDIAKTAPAGAPAENDLSKMSIEDLKAMRAKMGA